ncbi:MAG: signal peptidase I [Gaiellaceae bacterium]
MSEQEPPDGPIPVEPVEPAVPFEPPVPAWNEPVVVAPRPADGGEPQPPTHSRNPLERMGVPQPWRTILDWVVTIVGAIAIVLAIKAWIVNPYRIPSSSMEPTLHCARPASGCESHFSDRVLACRFCYWFHSPRRGDIVVFRVPDIAKVRCGAGGVFVKRIIGLPGETWSEKEGIVYINGKKLNEPYIKPDRRDFQTSPHPIVIDPAHYFMMGDNRASSCDSRVWGTVPRANIIGNVFAIYWPPQRIRFM